VATIGIGHKFPPRDASEAGASSRVRDRMFGLFCESKATTGSARNLRRLLRKLRPLRICNCPLSTPPIYGHLSFFTVATPVLTVLSDPSFRRQYSHVPFEVLLMSGVKHSGAEESQHDGSRGAILNHFLQIEPSSQKFDDSTVRCAMTEL
jgi:hypothetical protein